MSNVFQLAIDLQDGNIPEHPASPASANVAPIPQAHQFAKVDDDFEGDSADNETSGTPSPLAQRASCLRPTGNLVDFTAINAAHEEYKDEEKH